MWDYVDGVLDGSITTGKYIKLAYQRFVDDLGRAENDESFEWVFNPTEAARYVQEQMVRQPHLQSRRELG